MDTSHLAQHAGTAGALFATIFVVATTTMKTMIPLRVFGILANIILILTAIPARNYLMMVVQVIMLLVNSYRLHQMLQLVRDVKKSVNSDLSMEWLKPFMTERQCQAGEVLFYKDEKAEEMFYLARLYRAGVAIRHHLRLVEITDAVRATGLPKDSFCMACYDGNYPVAYDPEVDKEIMERRRSRAEGLGAPINREEDQIKLL
jgi:hypothetical protein